MKRGDIVIIKDKASRVFNHTGIVYSVDAFRARIDLHEPWPCESCNGGKNTPWPGCTDCLNTGYVHDGYPADTHCPVELCEVIGHETR